MITAGVVFAFLGKVGVAASFAIVFNFTAEIYPTVLRCCAMILVQKTQFACDDDVTHFLLYRGNALGIGSMAARIGSIASPYIILVQDYVSWLPLAVFGSMSLLAGFLAFFFPETLNRTMPQTIPEAEAFYHEYYSRQVLYFYTPSFSCFAKFLSVINIFMIVKPSLF